MSENDEILTVDQDVTHDLQMGEALKRLMKNPDFNMVITEGYLKQKVLASVSLLAVPQLQNDRPAIMGDLVAASNLQYFFTLVESRYEGAKDPILSDEELEEIEDNGGVN